MWWIIVIVVAVLAAVGVGGAAVYYYVRSSSEHDPDNGNPSTDGGAANPDTPACPDLTIDSNGRTIKLSDLDGTYTTEQNVGGERLLNAGTITIQCGVITSTSTDFSEEYPNLTMSEEDGDVFVSVDDQWMLSVYDEDTLSLYYWSWDSVNDDLMYMLTRQS